MGLLDPPSVSPLTLKRGIATNPNARGTVSLRERGPIDLTRSPANPIFNAANQNSIGDLGTPASSPSLYWPWLVHASEYLGNAALDEYYLYWSTDHDTDTTDGVYLATAPTIAGPWRGRGRVFRDATVGQISTETPSVIWDEDTNLFLLYYQVYNASGANGTQTTLYATSPDGVTWTRGTVNNAIVVDIPGNSSWPGDGHTGYFRPFKIGRRWFAYHLMGGQNFSRTAISSSSDGRTWITDPRQLLQSVDQTGDFRLAWNSANVVQWRGQNWFVGQMSTLGSGAEARVVRNIAAPLAADMRHIIGKPYVLLYPPVGLETVNTKSCFAHVDNNGRLNVIYQTDNLFNLAYVE